MPQITLSTKRSAATWTAIFDWDGVIIDSRRHHEESWERLAREVRRPLPEGHFLRGFGRKNEFIIPEILQWTRLPGEIDQLSLRKEALYRDVVAERGLTPLPGVRPWLEQLRENNVPCAIGSSTHRANIMLSLKMIGFAPFFDAIITSEDVKIGKPDPAVFLVAAERVKTAPARCIVFEDALVGIAAAHAGGMRVVAVTTTHPASELTEAEIVVERLDALDLRRIEQLLEG
jgi:HAD superfamily hydrolase (TIGR01509 family)